MFITNYIQKCAIPEIFCAFRRIVYTRLISSNLGNKILAIGIIWTFRGASGTEENHHNLLRAWSDLSEGCRWLRRSSPAPGDTGPGRNEPWPTGCPAPGLVYNQPGPCHAAAASHGTGPCWCSTLPLTGCGSGTQGCAGNQIGAQADMAITGGIVWRRLSLTIALL